LPTHYPPFSLTQACSPASTPTLAPTQAHSCGHSCTEPLQESGPAPRFKHFGIGCKKLYARLSLRMPPIDSHQRLVSNCMPWPSPLVPCQHSCDPDGQLSPCLPCPALCICMCSMRTHLQQLQRPPDGTALSPAGPSLPPLDAQPLSKQQTQTQA